MRSFLATSLALLVNVAILPTGALAIEPAQEEASELVDVVDALDEDDARGTLDDDVVHSLPILHAPFVTMTFATRPWHPHPEGRDHPRAKRPPRAS